MTDTPKFTPGPWEVHKNYGCDGSLFIGCEHPEVGTVTHAQIVAGCEEADELGDMEANAHLIEAAPELYGVVREVVKNLQASRAMRSTTPWQDTILKRAEEVLLKAEGRS